MLLDKSQAKEFSIPGGTRGILYSVSPEQSIALVSMDGVYPLKGWSINDRCTETMYMIRGQLVVECDDQAVELKVGDIYSVPPGKKYRVKGKGDTVDLITPAWDSKQNHIITD